MAEKCALIVDDSRSARVVLQRMLEAHQLDVETAESAEDALQYLSDHRPDVIFMDHMMPGMDGFEAVQAIKDNPNTATIPIMMYTSQEGELYVGQARALGAVGVLPKQIEPVEVSRVLKSLRLIPGGMRRSDEAGEDLLPEAALNTQELKQLDDLDHNLRDLIQDLFDQQRAVLRRDLLDSYETIAARVAEEIAPTVDDESGQPEPAATDKLSPGNVWALVVLALTAMTFAFLYWQAETKWQQERDARAELASSLREQQTLSADGTLQLQESLNRSQERLDSVYDDAISLVQWSFNAASRYDWDEIPLNDDFAERLEQLVLRLDAIDFSGDVLVETHVGDFCYVTETSGAQNLAPPGLPVEQCDQIGMTFAEADRLGSQQSIAFANLGETIGERTSGRITIATSTLANANPMAPYPSQDVDLTAGEWNAAAAANNRVLVNLVTSN